MQAYHKVPGTQPDSVVDASHSKWLGSASVQYAQTTNSSIVWESSVKQAKQTTCLFLGGEMKSSGLDQRSCIRVFEELPLWRELMQA